MSDRQQDRRQAPAGAADLRKRAEAQAGAVDPVSLSLTAQTPEAIEQIFHELRVHQIELEMQNEELRTAQVKIEESQARYFDLYDLAPVGYVTVSENGLILEANLTAATLLGVKRGALVKQPLTRFILEEDQVTYYLHRKKLLKTGEPQRHELRLVRPDSSVFWAYLDATATAAKDPNAAPICRIVLVDITKRKQVEETLRMSEEKHREILEAMEEGYYEADLTGDLVFCNESFCKMTGYNYDELMGKSYKRFYNNPQAVFQAFNQVYLTGKSLTAIDFPAITRDGRTFHLELSISLHRNEQGEPVGFRGVVRDITERRQTDEKIRYLSYHDQLTGLYNRHFLEEEMARLNTKRQLPLTVIMADLNGLKLVNDTYCHDTGDEMLIAAATILKNSCREEDIIARWGGDEFVVLLPQTELKETRLICKRIQEGCECAFIEDVPMSIALGIAAKTSESKSFIETLQEAENDMYRQKLTERRSTKSTMVTSLLNTLAAKSFETEEHTRGMQKIAQIIGAKLNLPDSELHRLDLLITLHDIGKINISETILTKESSLTDDEWKAVKKHPEIGYRIAMATVDFAHVAEDILAHHERWDGTGYPQGLDETAISLLARITAIADAYEVMSNGRPYKKAMSKSEIIAEYKRCAGTHFDPELVKIFLSVMDSEEERP